MIKILKYSLLISLSAKTSLSLATDFSFSPHVNIANRQFDYVSNNNTIAGNIITAGLGLSVAYKNLYTDIKIENSLSSLNENTSAFLNSDINFERNDFTFSTGYALENTFILFTGYKQGKTTIDTFNSNVVELVAKGFFIGAGTGAQIKDWGILAFSAAYADLNTEYQDSNIASIGGNATGTSLSLSWKAPLTKELAYQIAMIRHSYAYAGFPVSNLRIQENILSLNLSLIYRF